MKTKACIIAILLAVGLTNSRAQDTWTQKADFGGIARPGAIGFSIGSKGYVGTGGGYFGPFYKDFWEYDPSIDAWTQKADFGGLERTGAASFTIGNKGYVGTGRIANASFKDFWEYDPATNIWTQKADFGGRERAYAVGFSVGTKGFIGTGRVTFSQCVQPKDLWEYDPTTDTWTQKANFPGRGNLAFAASFAINSKGYIGTGYDCIIGVFRNDFWEYDPATDAWTRKADFGGIARSEGCGLSIGSKGYIGFGADEFSTSYDDFWEYDPVTNAWTQKANFGAPRWSPIGFSIGSKGYVGTGQDQNGTYYKDFWEYTPDSGGGGLTLTSAASRRKQAGQTFDINLPLSGTSGVEPRRPGDGGRAFVVFTFSKNVTAVDGTTSSCGSVVSTTIDSSDAHNVIVQGTGACNQQDVTVTLNGVHDDQGNTQTSAAVTVGFLYGDVNGDRRITLADLTQIRAHDGQAVDGSNFFNDINISGFIDGGDVYAAALQRGHRLP